VNPLLDLQQSVNFRIIDELRLLGLELAYPTERLFLDGHRSAVEK